MIEAEIVTNPIDKRFGPDFFKRVPKLPGIYWITDIKNQCLFVGKSRNLHLRILQFKQLAVKHEKWSFLEQAHNMFWEEASAEDKLDVLKSKWISELKPKYNAIVDAEYFYIGSSWDKTNINFSFASSIKQVNHLDALPLIHESKKEAHKVFSSFLRLLWLKIHQDPKLAYPFTLIKPQGSLNVCIPVNGKNISTKAIKDLYLDFFLSQDTTLLHHFYDLIDWSEKVEMSSFHRGWMIQDLTVVSSYHSRLKNIISGRIGEF